MSWAQASVTTPYINNGSTVVKPIVTTVAALPAAASNKGALAMVTDSNQTAIAGLGLTVANGGANNVTVYSDGTNWIVV